MRRRPFASAFVVSGLCAAVLAGAMGIEACDAYDAAPTPPVESDAESADADGADGGAGEGGQDAGDASICTGEPDWATPTSATTTAVCAGQMVDLLSSAEHCGRCNHSCGAQACVDGTCAERREDDATSILEGVHGGALFYAVRPGGSIGSSPHQLKKLVPGSTPFVLGALAPDAGTDSFILSTSVFGDDVYVRTGTSLRRAGASGTSPGVPTLVASVPSENVSSVVATVDRVYMTLPGAGRIDQVFLDGGSAPFVPSAASPVESALAGTKYVWLTQPFALFKVGSSSVHVHEGATDKLVYESPDRIAGIAIDGNDLFFMRASANGGAIMHVDLATGAATPFFEGELDTPVISMSVAVDATHVYWLKGTVGTPVEIWKRARCGGAAVRIGRHAFIYRVRVLGDRLYLGGEDGLFSIAK